MRWLALLLAAAAGCSRCAGERSAASADELLPPRAPLVIGTGDLGASAQRLAGLVERAGTVPGGEQLGDIRRQVAAQLGFDPLKREGLLAAGLDPGRSAALVATLPGWVVALPLTKPELFAQTIDRLLREKAGFAVRTEEAHQGVRCAVYARESGGPKVATAIVRGYGLIARGDDPAREIGAAAARPREQALAADAAWSEVRTAMKASPPGDAALFAPAGSAIGLRAPTRKPLAGDSSAVFSFASDGLSVRLRAGLSAEDAKNAQALLPGGGADLLPLLPRDAPFKARLGLSPAAVPGQIARLPLVGNALAALRREASARGVDLDKDLFGSLKPGLVASMATAGALDISKVVDFGFLDWRARSPFDFVQVAALAEVGDKPRLLAALEAVAAALPQVGARAERQGDGWQVTYAGGAGARFGVLLAQGRTLAYLVGGGVKPERLLPDPAAREPALEGAEGVAVAFDLGRLAAAVRALPESAYGSGPQSFIARSLVGQVIEPLKALRGSLQLAPSPGGLLATARVEIVAAGGAGVQNRGP